MLNQPPIPPYNEEETTVIDLLAAGLDYRQTALTLGLKYGKLTNYYFDSTKSGYLPQRVPGVDNKAKLINWYLHQVNLRTCFPKTREELDRERRSCKARYVATTVRVYDEQLISMEVSSPTYNREATLKKRAEYLSELGLCIFDIEPPTVAFEEVQEAILFLDDWGEEVDDKEALAFSRTLSSIGHYRLGHHDEARNFAWQAMELDAIQDPYLSFIPVSLYTICSAHLGEISAVYYGNHCFKKMMKQDPEPTNDCLVNYHLTMGRSLAILRDPRCKAHIRDGWRLFFEEEGAEPFLHLGPRLTKATLETVSYLPVPVKDLRLPKDHTRLLHKFTEDPSMVPAYVEDIGQYRSAISLN